MAHKQTLAQITHRDASKIKGLKNLAQLCGYSLNHLAAFGDDYYDVDIIAACLTGITIGNEEEDVKNIADIIAETNDEDWVYEVLESIIRQERLQ